MDVANQLVAGGQFRVIKEPLGFIKLLEWDCIVTAVFTFLWLVSSSAWAKGLSDVKLATDPENLIRDEITACDKESKNICQELKEPIMSGLNTSVVFGFLNCIIWLGNVWFVFKETGWTAPFVKAPPPAQEKQPAPESFSQGQGFSQQDSYAQQGGYQPDYYAQQPDYNQQGYSQGGYTQQGAPTSFSNQM
ncbi:hypothetical protein FKM82_027816 [Ascaphus truei]